MEPHLITAEQCQAYQLSFSKSSAGQKVVSQYIWRIKGRNLQPRIFYPWKILFKFEEDITIFIGKQNPRVQHHKTSFTRNVKRTFLSRVEKTTTRNIKAMKEKNLIGKGKYTENVVHQSLIQLVGRLKGKRSKIADIYNKQNDT